jgi:hypothetical protein
VSNSALTQTQSVKILAAVSALLIATMFAVWFAVKGPNSGPAALPFLDEQSATEESQTTSTGQTTTTLARTTESVEPTTTATEADESTTSTSSSVVPATQAGPSTSTGIETVDTIVPLPTAPTVPAPGSTTTTTGSTTLPAPSTRVPPTTAAPTTAAPTTTPATTAPPTTQDPGPASKTLVFADEFDSFNSSVWTAEHSTYGDGNNELQCYTTQQVRVANGKLILTAEARTETCPNGDTRGVTSGMVRSRGVEFAPGQTIEFRVKLTPNDEANQAGLWPAVWSSGWAGGWPAGGEWDGLEVMTANNPARSVYSIHYANSAGRHDKTSKEIVGAGNFSANWHIVRFDYGINGVLTWHLDGEVISVVDAADTLQGYPAPFDSAMTQLKINLALGGTPGALDARALPATFEVDYIRIYE